MAPRVVEPYFPGLRVLRAQLNSDKTFTPTFKLDPKPATKQLARRLRTCKCLSPVYLPALDDCPQPNTIFINTADLLAQTSCVRPSIVPSRPLLNMSAGPELLFLSVNRQLSSVTRTS